MSMFTTDTEHLKAGIQFSKPVFNREMTVILKAHTELTEDKIREWKQKGFKQVKTSGRILEPSESKKDLNEESSGYKYQNVAMMGKSEETTPLGINMRNGLPLSFFVTDDSASVRNIVRQYLLSQGFKFSGEAIDGNECVSKMAQQVKTPDILFMDIDMPGKNGIEALKDLKPLYPEMKVIMISGHSSAQMVQEAMKTGINGYLVKPFDRKTLLEKTARVLKRKAYGP